MIQVQIGQDKKISLEAQKDQLLIDGNASNYEVIKISDSSFKVFGNKKIYNINVVSQVGKELTLNINNQEVTVKVSDHIDQILEKLGMDTAQSTSVSEIKAPMPGSILSILVNEGQEVQAGDQILILEAMKMENVIKSSGDGVVSKIHISEKDNVEKNQVLISFE